MLTALNTVPGKNNIGFINYFFQNNVCDKLCTEMLLYIWFYGVHICDKSERRRAEVCS